MAARTSWRLSETLSWRSALRLGGAIVLCGLIAAVTWQTAIPITMLVVAISAAETLDPFVRRCQRYLSRDLAVALVYLVLGCGLALMAWIFGSNLASESRQLTDQVPAFMTHLQEKLEHLRRSTGIDIGRNAQSIVQDGSTTTALFAVPVAISQLLGQLLIIFFLSIYWSIEMPAVKQFVLSRSPAHVRDRVESLTADLGAAMGGYFRGVAINAIILGPSAALVLWWLGVPFPLALGLATALGEFVPYLGAIAAGLLATLAGFSVSLHTGLMAMVFYILLQEFEAHVLSPNIMRSQTQAPAGLVLFGFTAGFALGGVLGGIAGIPIAAALRVLIVDLTPKDPRHATL